VPTTVLALVHAKTAREDLLLSPALYSAQLSEQQCATARLRRDV
jgi:hypothetical protein